MKNLETTENKKKKIKISVRSLVEFVLRCGDIDNRKTSGAEKDAMQAGTRIHKKIQRQMGAGYRAEVALRHVIEEERYQIELEGRADGIMTRQDGSILIDEIKGVYLDLARIEEPIQVHLAQALCYAYMYSAAHDLDSVSVQITYCNLETEDIRRFTQEKDFEELNEWFCGLIHEYTKWAEYLYTHELRRQESLKELKFPYEYREGQKELATAVYRTLARGKNLFVQAPTGVGKTLSTVYPALKAMGEGLGDKLFYLTAKTITRSVAEECFSLLHEQGLYFSEVTITAKEKICPLEKCECNPEACACAKGHFDRVNDAVFDIIHAERKINRQTVLAYAEKYQVCPFEFSLDISSFVDGIICDYNYVFDPNARLKRYFGDSVSGNYFFLVDEAHNLVSRAREMFSAVLVKEDFLTAKRILKGRSIKVERLLERCNKNLLAYKRECEAWVLLADCAPFAMNLMRLFSELESFLEEQKEFEDRELILQLYFDIRHFMNMYENLDEHYRIYTQMQENGNFSIRLFCMDPSRCLKECLEKGKGSVFFSATLLPVNYYKKLLSGNLEDYAVYAKSSFPPQNRMLLISKDVSSRYTRRNPAEYQKVIDYICALALSHKGNYMVFFPSYQYMENVARQMQTSCNGLFEWKLQESHMEESVREEFLKDFEVKREQSFVACCVLGGIFSEGIDLKEERLEGVIVVGTGLPMISTEQEILKDYFDEHENRGFDYAYQYPGMNKVLQAAGRVIRTARDRGVILLLDDRFLRPELQSLFPREWEEFGAVTRNQVGSWLQHFWNSEHF